MKKLKRTLLFLLSFSILMSLAVPFTVSAGSENGDISYEAVLLIDTSESMEFSDYLDEDNCRVSVESIKSFAGQCTQDCPFYISVVIYNSDAYTLIESMDVSTEEGLRIFSEQLDQLYEENKTFVTESGEFECWKGKTDIGGALSHANKILEKSQANKKAVLLFTDGKIELGDHNKEQASADLAVSVCENLKQHKTPLFCIGLNRSGMVDKEFLQALSDRTGKDDKFEKTVVCTNASQLTELFHNIYSYFTGNISTNPSVQPLPPSVPYTKKFDVYKDAIKELNINLTSDEQLDKIKITDPSGTDVLDIVRDEEQFYFDESRCKFTEWGCNIVNIKLYYPEGGQWSVTVESQVQANVSIGSVFIDDLVCVVNVPDQLLAGEAFQCETTMIAGNTGNPITDKQIYEDSNCLIQVYNELGEPLSIDSESKINQLKNGYSSMIALENPGKYTIKTLVRNPECFEVVTEKSIVVSGCAIRLSESTMSETEIKIEIINPFTSECVTILPNYLHREILTLDIYKNNELHHTKPISFAESFVEGVETVDISEISTSGNFYCVASINGEYKSNKYYFDISDPGIKLESNGTDFHIDDSVSLTITLYDKETSLAYAELPHSFDGAAVLLKITKNGFQNDPVQIPLSRFENGVYIYQFNSTTQGKFTCTAEISKLSLSSETVDINIVNRPVTVVSQPKDISGKIKLKDTDKFETSISLAGLFSDEDGHELDYDFSASNEEIMEIFEDKETGTLYLTIKGAYDGTVTITADDNHGSTADVTFKVFVNVIEPVSPVVIITIISVIVGVLLLTLIIFLIVVKKTSVIDTKFKIEITVSNPPNNSLNVCYNTLASPRNFGDNWKKRSVSEIINGTNILSTSPRSPADQRIRSLAILESIYIEGLPFHQGIKLHDGKKNVSLWHPSYSAAELSFDTNDGRIVVKVIGI